MARPKSSKLNRLGPAVPRGTPIARMNSKHVRKLYPSHQEREPVSNRFRPVWLAVPALCMVVLAGCAPAGPQTATVSGNVRYKGKALPVGTVSFHTDKGLSGSS